ncbi:hypothetical protein AK812_SmicGene19717 [Symbiodinium microadriaticum]|uniref:Uncharacterized protein n=1 Tax=Symbiodinium microadriaticum TaxID=2951 RepID=A0A1Q9DRV7_SYMMI|nr:hypothetical protein AK812_SmicGene19717 [Symbiodinium microadriaticum]
MLRQDLHKAGIDFSETRYDGRTDLPSCMDVWVDNIMCDAMACKSHCWTKFFNPANQKTEITGNISWYNFNAQCLRCDEENCGPAFIKKCKFGRYAGVPESELPTDPKPKD